MNGRVFRYAQVLRAVALEAQSQQQIADRIGAHLNSTRQITVKMHALRLIHVERPQASRHAPALWRLGNQPDAVERRRVVLKPGKIGSALIQFAALFRALQEPRSTNELAELVGTSLNTTRAQLLAMRKAGIAYRCGYHRERINGAYEVWWQFGIDKNDVARPRKKTKAEHMAVYRANRSSRERFARINHALAANAVAFNQAA